MFLKVPEGFQRKKISSCPDTLLLPKNSPCAMQHIMWSAEGCWLGWAAAAPGPLQCPQTQGGNYAAAVDILYKDIC